MSPFIEIRRQTFFCGGGRGGDTCVRVSSKTGVIYLDEYKNEYRGTESSLESFKKKHFPFYYLYKPKHPVCQGQRP